MMELFIQSGFIKFFLYAVPHSFFHLFIHGWLLINSIHHHPHEAYHVFSLKGKHRLAAVRAQLIE